MKVKKTSKVVTDVNDLNNNRCPITFDNLTNQVSSGNVIKLNCGHCFNYKAFIKSYLINNKNIYSYKKCPYCFSNINKIPLVINKREFKLI